MDDIAGLDEIGAAAADRSINTPDKSQKQELLSPESGSNAFEEVSRVAATLYLEMKRCLKTGNLKAFREACAIVREILKR